jgi:hypothetical protein
MQFISNTNEISVPYLPEKYCIHKYLTKCKTNPQPPGFADFLRGTIALYIFSKKYNYKLLIDGNHPLFHYLKQNENIIYSDNLLETEELLPPLSYEYIYVKLDSIFQSGTSFSIMTNSFYNLQYETLTNFGEITSDCASYIKNILSPTVEIENKLKSVFNLEYKINMTDNFKIIHLRFGDRFLHENIYDDFLYNLYYNKINILINENQNEKYILLSDSSIIAQKLKTNIPELLYWNNSKVHLGDLKNMQDSSILDTLLDFFIMSMANEIIAIGYSGFSCLNSIIYNINYTPF